MKDKWIVIAMIAGMSLSHAHANLIVFSDDFTNADTSPTETALDSGWYRYGDFDAATLPGTAPDNYFSVRASSNPAAAAQWAVFKDYPGTFGPGGNNTLGIGESLTVSLTLTGTANLMNSDVQFRLSLGTRAGTPSSLSETNVAMNATDANREAIVYQQGTGTSTAGGSVRYAGSSELNETMIGGFTVFTNLFSGASTSVPNFTTNNATISLEYLRLDADTLSVSGAYTHPDGTSSPYNDVLVDATGRSWEFDTIAIGARDWDTDREFQISEVSVTHIPEPSTVALLLLGLATVTRFARRQTIRRSTDAGW